MYYRGKLHKVTLFRRSSSSGVSVSLGTGSFHGQAPDSFHEIYNALWPIWAAVRLNRRAQRTYGLRAAPWDEQGVSLAQAVVRGPLQESGIHCC